MKRCLFLFISPLVLGLLLARIFTIRPLSVSRSAVQSLCDQVAAMLLSLCISDPHLGGKQHRYNMKAVSRHRHGSSRIELTFGAFPSPCFDDSRTVVLAREPQSSCFVYLGPLSWSGPSPGRQPAPRLTRPSGPLSLPQLDCCSRHGTDSAMPSDIDTPTPCCPPIPPRAFPTTQLTLRQS